MNVWPFVFAASRASDYQFVVLPDIFDANTCDAVRERLEINDSNPKELKTATVVVKQTTINVWYRSGPIVIDDATQTDSAGRKLLFAYGLAATETAAGSALQTLSNLIDNSRPNFESGIASFLGTSGEWKPRVIKAIVIPTDQTDDRPAGSRKFNSSVAFLFAALIICLGLCAVLYSKNNELEAQLSELKSKAPKPPSETGSNTKGKAALPAPAQKLPEPAPAQKLSEPAPAQKLSEPATAQKLPEPAPDNSESFKKSFEGVKE